MDQSREVSEALRPPLGGSVQLHQRGWMYMSASPRSAQCASSVPGGGWWI